MSAYFSLQNLCFQLQNMYEQQRLSAASGLEVQNQQLLSELAALKDENDRLMKDISSLHQTAKAEIEQKDKEIMRPRKDLR